MADQHQVIRNEMLRLLFDQTAEHALMMLDTEGRISAWYGAAERLFGYTADEAIGQPISILFTEEGRAAGMDRYELDVARANAEAEDDRWMLRKDGSRFWAGGVVSPIRDANGTLLGFGKLLRDRTDLREQVETLKNQNQHLQEVNERKNQFISTVAHELRNPLSSVMTVMEILKMGTCSTDDVAQMIPILDREARSMRKLVDDLNEATRAAAGKIQLDKTRQDLRPIIESAIESCQSLFDSERQTLRVILPQAPVFVDLDAERMRQVLVNLIQNAATATRNGGTIWIKNTLEGNDTLFKVEDNGVGISHEVLPRIFELFTQAEFASDREHAGMGIGLSVVKHLVTLHDGTVQVRSDGLGKGSEFSIRLPLAE